MPYRQLPVRGNCRMKGGAPHLSFLSSSSRSSTLIRTFTDCLAREAHSRLGAYGPSPFLQLLRRGRHRWIRVNRYAPRKPIVLDDGARPTPYPEQNQILAALPPAALARLSSHLTLTRLPLGGIPYETGDALSHIYFPTDSIVSLTRLLADGTAAETSMVGNDGAIGIALFMGKQTATSRALVHSAGHAFRLSAAPAKQEFERHGALQHLALRYMHAQMAQIAQNVACNRHHSIEQHFCRWLLHSLDRLPTNTLCITQSHIAHLLGVRRESITAVNGKLLQLGIIECWRGKVMVRDRLELERLSCECYRVLRSETDRLRLEPAVDSGSAQRIPAACLQGTSRPQQWQR